MLVCCTGKGKESHAAKRMNFALDQTLFWSDFSLPKCL